VATQIPSLQTLRAFEAAGRLSSYSKAAHELGLTHGAVSHRIRELELQLGRQLFRRVGNTMVLTNAGAELAPRIRQGLSLLEQAFEKPRTGAAASANQRVVLTAVPSMASTWLFARLSEFRVENPQIDVELRVSEALSDYKADGIDLGVRLGAGGWPGLNTSKLFDEALTPVCTPAYAKRIGLKAPADLARATLLRNVWTPWVRWFRAAGLDWSEPSTGPSYDDSPLLLRAAMQGDGVALARHWLAVDELRAGKLVMPFDINVGDDFSYWLAWPTRARKNASAEKLRTWLAARAASQQQERWAMMGAQAD
jgi:LysR family glycine cleavage system transcriptional activator